MAHSRVDHLLFSFKTGQALVPKDDRYRRQLAEISGEGSGGLAARAFGVVHVKGQAQHNQPHVFSRREFDQTLRVECKFCALNGVAGSGKLSCVIGCSHADGFRSKVQGHEAQAHGQSGNGGQGGFEEGGHALCYSNRHSRESGNLFNGLEVSRFRGNDGLRVLHMVACRIKPHP